MDSAIKAEDDAQAVNLEISQASSESTPAFKSKNKNRSKDGTTAVKRRCVSTACIACRRRKSKCDGNIPKCAACASVYLTECEYAPHTDHRRKGVYKKDIDSLKTRNSTLQTLIHAILTYEEEDVPDLVRQIRTCESLEDLADEIVAREKGLLQKQDTPDSPIYPESYSSEVPQFEAELSGKMGDLLLDGSIKFIGGTSNLIWLPPGAESQKPLSSPEPGKEIVRTREEVIMSWTTVTQDMELILHLINMYFCWHYAFFTTLSKELFYRDFLRGTPTQNCSALLVNVMLCLGCHFTSWPGAREDPEDSATTGDHFFKEAKRLMFEDEEVTNAKLCTVQALALMSVREAGCGREGKGWVYSGMSFRMACDLGLQVDAPAMSENSTLKDEDIDARKITLWGCFLFDKCWSNYLGRIPLLQRSNITIGKPEVFGSEDSETWSPYTDAGMIQAHSQPARTRAVALQISALAEISSDLLLSFYHHSQMEKPIGKQAELKKLSDLHTRLEIWKKELPQEMEPKEGQLPQVLLMHMFFQLLFIHLYRPFLKYTRTTSPLPSHISPRKFCTQAAGAISKLLRLYKRTHGLRQICNIAVYIAHSACTIHLLNLPDKNATRDIIHGVKNLEEIGECWTCARRTLRMLHVSSAKWKIDLPEEVAATFARAATKWGTTDFSASPLTGFSEIPFQSHQNAQNSGTGLSHDPPDRSTNTQQIPNTHAAMPHLHNGMLPGMAASPASTMSEPRRSSGGMPLPPQSASDLNQASSKFRSSKYPTHLTQAQQDAWDRHRAARIAANTYSSGSSSSANTAGNANAAVLFGGVDSLVEESQDWWLKDQSALALGFDNWIDPGTDWAGLGFGSSLGNGGGGGGGGGGNGISAIGSAMDGNGTAYTAYSNKPANGYGRFDVPRGEELNMRLGSVSASAYRHRGHDSLDEDMYF